MDNTQIVLLTAFCSLLVSIVTGVVIAITGFWLNSRGFISQRWWDRKADAYAQILEALSHGKEYVLLNCRKQTGVTFTKEHEDVISDARRSATVEVTKAANIGAYIISGEAAEVLSKLVAPPSPPIDWSNTSLFEILEQDLEDYSNAIKAIRDIAKKDLKVGANPFLDWFKKLSDN